uniref:Uncharacterized protein n=1 Tax=Anguilla anguilla TaxID=7936 RepID=A0A0E9TBJ7_ANGAN
MIKMYAYIFQNGEHNKIIEHFTLM